MIATKGPLFEYACHEGNYGLANILRGARFTEKKAREPQTVSRRQSTRLARCSELDQYCELRFSTRTTPRSLGAWMN